MTRREYLAFVRTQALFITVLLLGNLPTMQASATYFEPLMDPALRHKLLLLLRQQGIRGGLHAQLGAVLGLYNRGQNILVARMSVVRGKAVYTFGRIVMRHRELYYWALQPDVNVLTTYFFLTDSQFRVVARGAELIGDRASALPPERTEEILSDLAKRWVAILDAAHVKQSDDWFVWRPRMANVKPVPP